MDDNENQNADSQSEAVRTEVEDIMLNPENPRHAGYKRNDPVVTKHIDQLYKNLVGDDKVELGAGLNLETSDQSEQTTAEAWATVRRDLASEWGEGNAFDQRMELNKQFLADLFKGKELLFQQLAQVFPSDAEALRLVDKIRQGRKE